MYNIVERYDEMNNKDQIVVNNIRCLAIDMIDEAKSGHPGISLGAAPIVYTVYANHLRFSSVDDKWLNRDRFIMSAGHGSALLYATLHMAGFDITIEDLKRFRRIDSKTPGHPELGVTPGVDASTGVLGEGVGIGVGIALGERYLENLLDKYVKGQELINYNTYVLCSDGDLMEGLSYEACSFAGTQKLGKLILLYDSNNVSLDGTINSTFNENIKERFESMSWHYQLVKNGEDLNDIDSAINKAKSVKDKPSIIEVKTVIGYGSFNAGKNIVHGKPLSKEDLSLVKERLKIKDIPFYVDEEANRYFKEKVSYRMSKEYSKWGALYNEMRATNYESVNEILNLFLRKQLTVDFARMNLEISPNHREELRNSNYRIINAICAKTNLILGGGADTMSSTKTGILLSDDLIINNYDNPLGRNIFFGVREHAMAAIMNGIALTDLRCFGSTFLTFSNHMLPSMRMATMMNLPVTYIFTHDSITVGEDGRSHEPVEQLSMLRSIPNMIVYRPADIIELLGVWEKVITEGKPATIIVNKNDSEIIKGTNKDYAKYGGYLIRKEVNKLDGIIIATGSEVRTATIMANELFNVGIDIRVVSMPSFEIFNKVDRKYQDALLPKNVKTVVIEASNDKCWYKYTNEDFILNIKNFGYSGKKDEVLKKMNFDYQTLKSKVETLLR